MKSTFFLLFGFLLVVNLLLVDANDRPIREVSMRNSPNLFEGQAELSMTNVDVYTIKEGNGRRNYLSWYTNKPARGHLCYQDGDGCQGFSTYLTEHVWELDSYSLGPGRIVTCHSIGNDNERVSKDVWIPKEFKEFRIRKMIVNTDTVSDAIKRVKCVSNVYSSLQVCFYDGINERCKKPKTGYKANFKIKISKSGPESEIICKATVLRSTVTRAMSV